MKFPLFHRLFSFFGLYQYHQVEKKKHLRLASQYFHQQQYSVANQHFIAALLIHNGALDYKIQQLQEKLQRYYEMISKITLSGGYKGSNIGIGGGKNGMSITSPHPSTSTSHTKELYEIHTKIINIKKKIAEKAAKKIDIRFFYNNNNNNNYNNDNDNNGHLTPLHPNRSVSITHSHSRSHSPSPSLSPSPSYLQPLSLTRSESISHSLSLEERERGEDGISTSPNNNSINNNYNIYDNNNNQNNFNININNYDNNHINDADAQFSPSPVPSPSPSSTSTNTFHPSYLSTPSPHPKRITNPFDDDYPKEEDEKKKGQQDHSDDDDDDDDEEEGDVFLPYKMQMETSLRYSPRKGNMSGIGRKMTEEEGYEEFRKAMGNRSESELSVKCGNKNTRGQDESTHITDTESLSSSSSSHSISSPTSSSSSSSLSSSSSSSSAPSSSSSLTPPCPPLPLHLASQFISPLLSPSIRPLSMKDLPAFRLPGDEMPDLLQQLRWRERMEKEKGKERERKKMTVEDGEQGNEDHNQCKGLQNFDISSRSEDDEKQEEKVKITSIDNIEHIVTRHHHRHSTTFPSKKPLPPPLSSLYSTLPPLNLKGPILHLDILPTTLSIHSDVSSPPSPPSVQSLNAPSPFSIQVTSPSPTHSSSSSSSSSSIVTPPPFQPLPTPLLTHSSQEVPRPVLYLPLPLPLSSSTAPLPTSTTHGNNPSPSTYSQSSSSSPSSSSMFKRNKTQSNKNQQQQQPPYNGKMNVNLKQQKSIRVN